MKGLDVTLVAPEPVLWTHLFGERVGAYFQGHMERHGVRVLTGRKTLPDGDYDMLLAGIGVSPNIELAQNAGLPTNKGVLADDHLVAAPDIWVAGDIAEYQSVIHDRRIRIEHWDVALNHGSYIGKSWAGAEEGPYQVVPYFFSDIGDWTWMEYVGPGDRDDAVEVRGSMDDDDFVAYYSNADGKLTACLAVNRGDELNAARAVIAGAVAFRCAAISSTVTIGRSWRPQRACSCTPRAIVPSAFISSHSTPPGVSPARRVRSIAASVCPRRSSTPLGRARSGKMWPGRTRSSGPLSGSIATWMVRARSAAEMPVVTPVRASIDTVKPVASQPSLAGTISGSSSSSQRWDGNERQISPRASQAMNAIFSAVTNSAAMHRSPSFSRSGSSHTTTMPPRRSCASAASSDPFLWGTALTWR